MSVMVYRGTYIFSLRASHLLPTEGALFLPPIPAGISRVTARVVGRITVIQNEMTRIMLEFVFLEI